MRNTSADIALIIEFIQKNEQGTSKKDILAELGIHLPYGTRALQNRLKTLVHDGILVTQGAGRSLKYQYSGEVSSATERLSTHAERARAAIQKPLDSRTPVGYNRRFLDEYEPNKSAYFTTQELEYLLSIGTPIMAELPAGTYVRQLLDRLLIDLSWNSSRLEGNTYSLLDTRRLLSFGHASEANSNRDAQMILNHKAAIEFMVDNVDSLGFNRFSVLNLHSLLSDNLLENPLASGRLRTMSVGIAQSTFLPLSVPALIEEYFLHILDKASHIENPFEQALFILVQLPYLQPFDDVNKRVSRLAANIPFVLHNLTPISFVDMSSKAYIEAMLAIYELNDVSYLKDLFVQSYERSVQEYRAVRQSLGEPDVFRCEYRANIFSVVQEVLLERLNRLQALEYLQAYSKEKIKALDQEQFCVVVETELLALHEGNFARYRVRPSEFEAWQGVWQ